MCGLGNTLRDSGVHYSDIDYAFRMIDEGRRAAEVHAEVDVGVERTGGGAKPPARESEEREGCGAPLVLEVRGARLAARAGLSRTVDDTRLDFFLST